MSLPAALSLSIDRSARARQQVYTTLRNAIVSAELEPGLSVSEQELAGHLGISRTPVREALIRLSEEGLVEIYPQTATVISPISYPEVYQSLVIRSALECRSLRYTVRVITASGMAALREHVAEQKRHVRLHQDDGFLAADDAFHRTMVTIAGHPGIWKVIDSTKAQHDRVRYLSTHLQVYNKTRIREHESILDAIERRDLADAERLLEIHLDPERLIDLWGPLLSNYGDFFEKR